MLGNAYSKFFLTGFYPITSTRRIALPLQAKLSSIVRQKENRRWRNSLSTYTIGSMVTDIWGAKVKLVKRGPRNARQSAYLNLKRVTSNLTDAVQVEEMALQLDDVSLPRGWTVEADSAYSFTFFRRGKSEFRVQRLSLEMLVELPLNPSSRPIYKVRSHGCVVDLGS